MRPRYKRIVLVAFAFLTAVQSSLATDLPKKGPNIVLLIADQLRYQSCGFAGDTRAIRRISTRWQKKESTSRTT